jgi:hypothetical protein
MTIQTTTTDRLRAIGVVTDGTHGPFIDPDKVLALAARAAAPSDGLRERIEALPWNPWRDEDEPLGPDERSWGAGVEWYVGEYRAAVLAELDRAALAAIPTDD